MKESDINFEIKAGVNNNDFNIFCVGIFFLASAPFISSLIFFYSIFKGLTIKKTNKFKNKYNIFLITASILMIIQGFFYSLFNYSFDNYSFSLIRSIKPWHYSLHWADICNWIPIFVSFVGFQPYLLSAERRLRIAKFLIAGTIPVVITSLGQLWLNWYGPFEVFFGLIKWFQKPLYEDLSVTGLFNNPNYTGAWVTLVLPFSLVLFVKSLNNKNNFKKITLFIINALLSLTAILTNSRAALLAFLITYITIFGKKFYKIALYIFLFYVVIFFIGNFLNLTEQINNFLDSFVPHKLITKLDISQVEITNISRISIWGEAKSLIIGKPILGWGASTFPIIYELKTGAWAGHAHNLFLELSLSYGLIISTLIYSTIILILFNGLKRCLIKRGNYLFIDQAYLLSGMIFLLAQFFDVLYFDVRLNIASWLILASISVSSSKNFTNKSEYL